VGRAWGRTPGLLESLKSQPQPRQPRRALSSPPLAPPPAAGHHHTPWWTPAVRARPAIKFGLSPCARPSAPRRGGASTRDSIAGARCCLVSAAFGLRPPAAPARALGDARRRAPLVAGWRKRAVGSASRQPTPLPLPNPTHPPHTLLHSNYSAYLYNLAFGLRFTSGIGPQACDPGRAPGRALPYTADQQHLLQPGARQWRPRARRCTLLPHRRRAEGAWHAATKAAMLPGSSIPGPR
jgi:hypothetical protein